MAKELLLVVFTAVFSPAVTAFAAHPLITDDTGTQGKGKAQVEFTGEYGHDSENGITTNILVFPKIPVLTYGITDTADLVLGVPFERRDTKQVGGTTTERGISDVSLQLKWRFYEKEGLSIAVKPGVTLPTGDEDKGLGNGKASYSAFFIITKDMSLWVFHLNIGYLRNEYKLQADEDANRQDLWHVSLASQVDMIKGLKAVANIGMEKNSDKRSNIDPAFLLGGVIYSITESLDLDAGVKAGLNKPETDMAYLAGVTKRF
jgi:Putative MetA-pathway of phenol degradation